VKLVKRSSFAALEDVSTNDGVEEDPSGPDELVRPFTSLVVVVDEVVVVGAVVGGVFVLFFNIKVVMRLQ
jgi:hypothetical protein